MYHDLTDCGESGFEGPGAAVYKMSAAAFKAHLTALAAAFPQGPAVCDGRESLPRRAPFMLTFDDGGASAERIASELADRGWRGHFFITTGLLGRPGFLDRRGVRQIRAQGHVVGSHSHSHPALLSSLGDASLDREWSDSVRELADLLGEEVVTASVPGGYMSARVARSARDAGIRRLFTSTPTARVRTAGDLQVVGRFAMYADTTPEAAVALAGADAWAQRRQQWQWELRRPVKRVLGQWYPGMRRWWLARRADLPG